MIYDIAEAFIQFFPVQSIELSLLACVCKGFNRKIKGARRKNVDYFEFFEYFLYPAQVRNCLTIKKGIEEGKKYFRLEAPMSFGKTCNSLALFYGDKSIALKKRNNPRCIVVNSKSHATWKDEFKKIIGKDSDEWNHLLDMSVANDFDLVERYLKKNKSLKNYTIMFSISSRKIGELLNLGLRFSFMVCDESHSMKSKAMKETLFKLTTLSDHCLFLSAQNECDDIVWSKYLPPDSKKNIKITTLQKGECSFLPQIKHQVKVVAQHQTAERDIISQIKQYFRQGYRRGVLYLPSKESCTQFEDLLLDKGYNVIKFRKAIDSLKKLWSSKKRVITCISQCNSESINILCDFVILNVSSHNVICTRYAQMLGRTARTGNTNKYVHCTVMSSQEDLFPMMYYEAFRRDSTLPEANTDIYNKGISMCNLLGWNIEELELGDVASIVLAILCNPKYQSPLLKYSIDFPAYNIGTPPCGYYKK